MAFRSSIYLVLVLCAILAPVRVYSCCTWLAAVCCDETRRYIFHVVSTAKESQVSCERLIQLFDRADRAAERRDVVLVKDHELAVLGALNELFDYQESKPGIKYSPEDLKKMIDDIYNNPSWQHISSDY